jgi:putative redox protein
MSSAIDEAREAMDAIAERFATDEKARRTLTVGVVLGAGLRVDIDIRNHRLTVDEPKGIGGTDEGPSPVELLLASLTSCQAITYRVWAMKLGIALDTVAVETEGDMDLRGFLGDDEAIPAGFTALRLKVSLDGPDTPERYRELADAVDRHCPVLDFAQTRVPVERRLVDDSAASAE